MMKGASKTSLLFFRVLAAANRSSVPSKVTHSTTVQTLVLPEQQQQQPRNRWMTSSAEEKKQKGDDEVKEEEKAAPKKEEDAATVRLSELEEECKSLKDQLLRSLAEQENIRRIARRDVDSAKQFSIKSFAKSLLEVADNLDRALDSVEFTEKSSTFYQGVEMTNTGLLKALESHGVKIYCEEPGDKFDPTLHEALMECPYPDMEPGTVGQVIKRGFKLNQRVLRPAEVGVVVKVDENKET